MIQLIVTLSRCTFSTSKHETCHFDDQACPADSGKLAQPTPHFPALQHKGKS